MGNELAEKTNQTYKDPRSFLLVQLQSLDYVKMLKDNKLVKTVVCQIENEGLVIVKIYFCNFSNPDTLNRIANYSKKMQNLKKALELSSFPNVIPYQGLFNAGVF